MSRCAWCVHSRWRRVLLWCVKWNMKAELPCERYEREPGADDER